MLTTHIQKVSIAPDESFTTTLLVLAQTERFDPSDWTAADHRIMYKLFPIVSWMKNID